MRTKLRTWFYDGFQPDALSCWEWIFLRIAFAALVLSTFLDWHPYVYASQPAPVGIARWINLAWLNNDGVYQGMLVLASVCCAAYVFGFVLRLVLPLLTAAQIVVYTFQNSQGFTDHGVQLISMVLLFQSIVVWWKRAETPEKLRAWLWFYSRGIVLFSYVASALTKIINTRGLWVWRSKYLAIEMVKTRRYDYYEKLDPVFQGDPPVAIWLMHHPWVAQIMFGAGFFLEVFAFLGLRDRWWSALIGISLIALHQSVTHLMGLAFENHQWLILIFLINVPGWILLLWQKKQSGPLTA